MERNNSESKISKNWLRVGAIAVGLGFAAILAGCGQTDPPTSQELNDGMEFITLDEVKAANGEPVRCVMYGAESTGSNDSKSWFGFDCDFEGTANFPSEVQQTTATTLG